MGTAAVLLLLFLLSQQGGGAPEPKPPASSPPPSGGDGGKSPLGGLVTAGLGLLGTLVGGGGTAGAGATAAAAGSGVAVGGSTSGGGGAAAGAGVGVAAAFPLGAVTVALLANPIAWAVYFLIASKVVQAQEGEKTWQATLRYLNASARELHGFEQSLTGAILKQRGINYGTPLQQRDRRLDRTIQGLNVTLEGWRTTYRFVPVPGMGETWRKVRALSLEYLRLRAGHGYRMMSYYLPGLEGSEANWSVGEGKLNVMYEDATMPGSMPGIGGLLQIPLAAGGPTERPRLNNTEYPEDPAQLRAVGAEPLNNLSAEDLQLARFLALSEAIFALRFDPRPIIDLDADNYARDTMKALGTGPINNRVPLEGLSTRGGLIFTDPNVYGMAVGFNPQAIRQHTNAAGHEQVKAVTP